MLMWLMPTLCREVAAPTRSGTVNRRERHRSDRG